MRFFGIGGVFHSDEALSGYGITDDEIDGLKDSFGIGTDDAFLILAAPREKIEIVVKQIISRVEHIRDHKIPIDTRLATVSGETKFLRPRPGDARMYPETDIPVVFVTGEEMDRAIRDIPKSWDESIKEIQTRYGINLQLAEQLFDSRYAELFEKITEKTETSPTFVASVLCSSVTNLERSGLDSSLLSEEEIMRTFELLDKKEIAKESVQVLFEGIMSGKTKSVEEALRQGLVQAVDDVGLEGIIERIIDENQGLIESQRERAVKPLMGIAMKELRGKASGEAVNKILLNGVKEKLNDNDVA